MIGMGLDVRSHEQDLPGAGHPSVEMAPDSMAEPTLDGLQDRFDQSHPARAGVELEQNSTPLRVAEDIDAKSVEFTSMNLIHANC